jgi:hypothetical protein
MGFLPKRPYHTAVVDSQGFGFYILVHRLTKRVQEIIRQFARQVVDLIHWLVRFNG